MVPTTAVDGGSPDQSPATSMIRYCEIHPSKKVKFYCKNDR
jgi:hypothetical protein